MIDWHSHVLPDLDDGSRSIKESISLLEMQKRQGVKTVVATPHFYANDEAVDSFLERRRESFESLKLETGINTLEIVCGAEVRYYPGISRMVELKKLCIEGSKVLLLEMPMSRWTEYTVRELVELAGASDITIVLAHVERYYKLQKAEMWERIYRSGTLMQVNASYFTEFSTRHKAVTLLSKGEIHFIGSDCHNLTSRPPKLDRAYGVIKKKLGEDFINVMNEYGYSVLVQNKK